MTSFQQRPSDEPTVDSGGTEMSPVVDLPFLPADAEVVLHADAHALDQLLEAERKRVRDELEPRLDASRQALVKEVERLRTLARSFARATSELKGAAAEQFEQSVQWALSLAIDMARKLACADFSRNPAALAAMVRRVVAPLAERAESPITVYLDPKSFVVLQGVLTTDELADLVSAGVGFAEDPALPEGTVMAEAAELCTWWHIDQELEWLAEQLCAELRHDEESQTGTN